MIHYGKLLSRLIEEHDLSLGYLCKRLETTRYKLNKNLEDGEFTSLQKQFIQALDLKIEMQWKIK
jgi:hypothetical protein